MADHSLSTRNPKWHRDEIILALDLYFATDRGSIDNKNPKIIALSELLGKLPIFTIRPDEQKFRNANGVTLKLSNFLAIDPEYKGKGMEAGSRLDKEVFNEFKDDKTRLHRLANKIKEVAKDSLLIGEVQKVEDDELTILDSVKEGQVLYKLHKVRERNKKIVDAKKKKVLKEKNALSCEACGFDFHKTYGKTGEGFIECHHLVPLASYRVENKTRLEDLALLCSNCHKMIHRDMSITSIYEFKQKLLFPNSRP